MTIPDVALDVAFAKRTLRRIGLGRCCTVLLYSFSYAVSDFLAARIWKADVQDSLIVVLGHFDCTIDLFKDVLPYQAQISKNPHRSSVAVKQFAVFAHLDEFRLGHIHQSIDLVLASFEIFNAESEDGDYSYTTLVAHFQNLC